MSNFDLKAPCWSGKHMRPRMNQQQMEQLDAERNRLHQEINGLQARVLAAKERLAGLETVYAILNGASFSTRPSVEDASGKRPRGAVKDTVLRIVQDGGEGGVTALEVVDLAKVRGVQLDRGSTSSLLSKLKAAGTLELVGNRYRSPKRVLVRRPLTLPGSQTDMAAA